MSTLVDAPTPWGRAGVASDTAPRRAAARSGRWIGVISARWLWLALIAVLEVALSRLLPSHRTAFQDEGLYIYMGHRILDDLVGGQPLFEFPGAYFSGAPAFYPVLAAIADSIGGLAAVRDLSLLMIIVTTFVTQAIGETLYGRLAGLFGALSFAICGSVSYVSQWATFDALAMMLGAIAVWLAITSARRDGLLFAPMVGLVLFLAVFAKYAAAMYVPIVATLAVAVGWRRWGRRIVHGAALMIATAAILFLSVVLLWGRGLLPGLAQTTTERHVLNPAGPGLLIGQTLLWVGPWLVLALIGGLLRIRRQPLLVLTLLGGAVLAPLQQIHIGEATSLRKHVAFGLVFACVLVGSLLARAARTKLLVPVVVGVCVALAAHGAHFGGQFRTAYPQDAELQAVLREALAANSGMPILAEQSSAQRYELRDVTQPRQWHDTYVFKYAGLSGTAAYERAIKDHYFGVIYLNFTTPESHRIVTMLSRGDPADRYYHLVALLPGYVHGERAGSWLVWTPQNRKFTPIP